MEIYLDNSSTTRPYSCVCDKVADVMQNTYGNPSSLHRLGIAAEKELKAATAAIAETLGARNDEIFYTSGGTESNNLAIRGVCRAARGKHIISTPIEHPASLNTLYDLEDEGYTVDFIPVDSDGRVILSEFEKLLRPDTVLVTAMLVNNEIGTVQPIGEMSAIIKSKCPSAYLHVDAVQGYCKVPCTASGLGADLISISGHKIHGPKGTGVLYIRKGTKLSPIIFGGGQQNGIRPGTENVPGIVGLGAAIERAVKTIDERAERLSEIRDHFIDEALKIERSRVNGDREHRLPSNVNMCFEGIEGESLLLMLDMKGICASSGSACTSGSLDPSHVLLAIGLKHEIAHGSLRLSFGEETTMEDADYILSVLPEIIEKLRVMSPLWDRIKKSESQN